MPRSRSSTTERGCATATSSSRCTTTLRSGSSASRPWCVSSGRTARSCSARAFPISRRPPAALPPGRRRPLRLRSHVRRPPGGALLRARPAPARPAGPEGGGHRPRSAQYRGLGAVRAVQPRLRVPVEHAGGRPRRAGRQPHEVGRGRSPADRLLGDDRAHARPTSSAATRSATGLPPMLPEWASGFWQSKLRYRDQDELLEVAREYKRRGLPLSVIVCDYFHWTRQGEWRFDPAEWPDPQAMVDELRELGVELMVSVWPTVNPNSDNYAEMDRRGLLVRNMAGLPLHLAFWDKGTDGQAFMRYYDATNPEARALHLGEGHRRLSPLRHPGVLARRLRAGDPRRQPRGRPVLHGPRLGGAGHLPPGARPRASTRGCGRAARTTCCCFAAPPGRAASATGPPSGRATSSPRSRRWPHRSRPA